MGFHHSPSHPVKWEIFLYHTKLLFHFCCANCARAHFFPPALLFWVSRELCLLHTSLNEKRIRHSIFSAFVSKINDCVLLLSPWLIPELCCQFRLACCQDLTHSKNSRKIAALHLISYFGRFVLSEL